MPSWKCYPHILVGKMTKRVHKHLFFYITSGSEMIRVSIIRRWKGNKPAVQSESSSVPSTFIKRLTKKKNLKEVVYEKKKSDAILNEG